MPALLDKVELPLKSATSSAWAAGVLAEPLALLSDHAHLERKAATNALELLHQWPDPIPPDAWVTTMTAVAGEEADHLQLVLRILHKRGGTFSRSHRNPYAKALRDLIRLGGGTTDARRNTLTDRLMVSALIEVRSCERFATLADYLAETGEDEELAKLYKGLWASEHGHYITFLDLARKLPGVPAEAIERRWQEMLEQEAAILADQSHYPGMHSGVPEDTDR
ncbi:tRNA-(ms[2]io[6]A)-hydroxylase [Algisphaera agarilytica]|uniref:tRNA-(Ms[2]io[6]A)-hydroxylase n=1 Tax=Algisphaera agarilytica TaxID=1385975 RepID=A0A7X0H8H2_9BACT|nr:tRNA-(ms[2]io[6]A)-hydroxylase [Algisphaera agarilytica]MBB6429760.1 tRNA-(ms[2]io[6]A)-hydroxylase [Algisphaera agarilytica]